jgi:hypothetical protein
MGPDLDRVFLGRLVANHGKCGHEVEAAGSPGRDSPCLAVSRLLLPRALDLVRRLTVAVHTRGYPLVANIKRLAPATAAGYERRPAGWSRSTRTATRSHTYPPLRSSTNAGYARGSRYPRSTACRTAGSWCRSTAAHTPNPTYGRTANRCGAGGGQVSRVRAAHARARRRLPGGGAGGVRGGRAPLHRYRRRRRHHPRPDRRGHAAPARGGWRGAARCPARRLLGCARVAGLSRAGRPRRVLRGSPPRPARGAGPARHRAPRPGPHLTG